MRTEKEQKQKQIRRTNGKSNYFQGGFEVYGRYQWNIKYYGFQSDEEIEYALLSFLGVYVTSGDGFFKDVESGFIKLIQLLKRPIESHIDGRSNGWLVISTELTDKELKIVDEYIESCMKQLPKLLKDFRKGKQS